jgi:hypothetical protein
VARCGRRRDVRRDLAHQRGDARHSRRRRCGRCRRGREGGAAPGRLDVIRHFASWADKIEVAGCHRLAAQLRAGGVWINGPGAPDARLPWGGLKASGIGRELRFAGIEGTTEEKTVTITF